MRYAIFAATVAAIVIGLVLWRTRGSVASVEYTMTSGEKTDDITKVRDHAKFKAFDPKFVPEEAQALHEQGRRYGSEGKLDLAMAAFSKASEIAPQWAYPLYDMAYTLLLQGNHEQAAALYKRVDALEPNGFFTTKTAVWSLDLEATGKIPNGTYLYYLTLEDIQDANARSIKAKAMWEKLPNFTPAFKDYVLGISAPSERLEMINKGLRMESDAETTGILMINKAGTLDAMGQKDEAIRILKALRDDHSQTLFTRTTATELLKFMAQ